MSNSALRRAVAEHRRRNGASAYPEDYEPGGFELRARGRMNHEAGEDRDHYRKMRSIREKTAFWNKVTAVLYLVALMLSLVAFGLRLATALR